PGDAYRIGRGFGRAAFARLRCRAGAVPTNQSHSHTGTSGRVLAAWNSGTTGTDIRWLIADQLGTPRIILDQSGSLASTTRHDYLPFGEELSAGGRTAANGYTNSDAT